MSNLNGRGAYVWEEITPELAAEYLEHDLVNRNVRKNAVATYAADMAAGNWRGTDAPITRRVDGGVLDGKHRLSAIVVSGVTIGMWVHYVSEDVKPMDLRVDVGRTRNLKDIAEIGTRMSGTARTLLGAAIGGYGYSVDTVLDVVDRIKPDFELLTTSTRRGYTTAGAVAATVYSIHAYPADAEVIAAQFNALATANSYPFWPGVTSAARQGADVMSGGSIARVLTFLKMAHAYSPAGRGLSRIVIKDLDQRRAELAPKVAAYIGLPS